MHHGPSQRLQWPFPRQAHEAEEEIEDLKNGYRLYSAVQVLSEEVPEDLGPEKALYCCCYLVCWMSVCESDNMSDRVVHIAAVRQINRAQWFLMSFPILRVRYGQASLEENGGRVVESGLSRGRGDQRE